MSSGYVSKDALQMALNQGVPSSYMMQYVPSHLSFKKEKNTSLLDDQTVTEHCVEALVEHAFL